MSARQSCTRGATTATLSDCLCTRVRARLKRPLQGRLRPNVVCDRRGRAAHREQPSAATRRVIGQRPGRPATPQRRSDRGYESPFPRRCLQRWADRADTSTVPRSGHCLGSATEPQSQVLPRAGVPPVAQPRLRHALQGLPPRPAGSRSSPVTTSASSPVEVYGRETHSPAPRDRFPCSTPVARRCDIPCPSALRRHFIPALEQAITPAPLGV